MSEKMRAKLDALLEKYSSLEAFYEAKAKISELLR